MCEPGKETTDAQRELVKQRLEANPEVQQVFYESKKMAYDDFGETFADSPILESLTVAQMQDSYRVKLRDPNQYASVVDEAKVLPGVQNVQDLHQVLDPLFSWLNALKWATIGMSGLLLLAAALQIANTIRMAAFARRRELGIMRLVGASNSYILLPFLLESLVAGVVGAGLAAASLAAGYWFIVVKNAQVSIQALRWITWEHAFVAMLWVALLGIVLSIVPTLIATKKYLRI